MNATRNKLLLAMGAAVLLALSGCQSDSALVSRGGDSVVGTVDRGLFEPHRVEIKLGDKVFRGLWRSSPPSKDLRDETAYPHRRHVSDVQLDLRADDGTAMHCNGKTHSEAGEIKCEADGRSYSLTLE